MQQGIDADRAMALADALEREGRLVDAIDALTMANRLRRDVDTERRLVRVRRDAYAQLDRTFAPTEWPHFAVSQEPLPPDGAMEVTPDQLSASAIRDGILRHGHLLVRGLVPPARVARLRECIDQAFAYDEVVTWMGSRPDAAAWCDHFQGIPGGKEHRLMVRASHGILMADVPRGLYEYLETIEDLGLRRLIAAYFGERPAISVMKCTLRRTDPTDWKVQLSNWHQDGAFLGEGIRTVNVWVALSKCGRNAPGMELIPRRLTKLLTRGEDSDFDWTVSAATISRELPGVELWRPEFEPGDVLMFDHWSLHRTAANPEMTEKRYAIESWFFAPSTYPGTDPTMLVV